MMKEFCVSVDFVMSKNFWVKAENEEQAMAIVDKMINNAPYDHARDFSHMVGHKIIDANEEYV